MKAVRLVNTATAEMLAKKTTKTIPGFAVTLAESFSEIKADFLKSADEVLCISISTTEVRLYLVWLELPSKGRRHCRDGCMLRQAFNRDICVICGKLCANQRSVDYTVRN
jgi:hypothetical protein